MKKLSELMSYYYDELYPHLSELEKKRQNVASKIRILRYVIVVLALFIIISAYLSGALSGKSADLLYWTIAVLLAVYGFLYKMILSGYRDDFKDEVIEKIIKFIEPSLEYDKTGSISKEEFIWSNIFKKHIDRFSGNDLVQGQIGKTGIKFSDILAEYKTRSKNRTYWHTIFKGQFFISDPNKEFNGHMLVLPDSAQKLFGAFGQFLQEHNPSRDKLIKMDNPTFEKEFVVYADDDISSRYVLTHSMMERILRYKYKTKRDIFLSFRNSKIFVAIAFNKDLFEPNPFARLNDFNTIKEYYESLTLVLGIVEELKLNRRVWSKD